MCTCWLSYLFIYVPTQWGLSAVGPNQITVCLRSGFETQALRILHL